VGEKATLAATQNQSSQLTDQGAHDVDEDPLVTALMTRIEDEVLSAMDGELRNVMVSSTAVRSQPLEEWEKGLSNNFIDANLGMREHLAKRLQDVPYRTPSPTVEPLDPLMSYDLMETPLSPLTLLAFEPEQLAAAAQSKSPWSAELLANFDQFLVHGDFDMPWLDALGTSDAMWTLPDLTEAGCFEDVDTTGHDNVFDEIVNGSDMVGDENA
jgi:hypothetical protein